MQNKLLRDLLRSYAIKSGIIQLKLDEFHKINDNADDPKLFEELTFCILAAGTSAKMALNSVNALSDILEHGDYNQIKNSLTGWYRYPNLRAYHIVYTREYLKRQHGFSIRGLLNSFSDNMELRRYMALNKSIMGIGFKEASHFLRNIGYGGFAILDKHIVNTLYDLKITDSNKTPTTERAYLEMENKLRKFSEELNINIDELDLLFWSEKTGEVLK